MRVKNVRNLVVVIALFVIFCLILSMFFTYQDDARISIESNIARLHGEVEDDEVGDDLKELEPKKEDEVGDDLKELEEPKKEDPYFFPKRRYLPPPKLEKSNEIFGYYFGPHDKKTGQWHDEPLPHDEEEIDCDKHNEEYLKLMYRMNVLIDIGERSQKYNLTGPEIKYFDYMNKHYMHYYEGVYRHLCKTHYMRRERRARIKTDVKWKEGETVVIHRKKKNEKWNAYRPLMNINCSVNFRLTGYGSEAGNSHIQISTVYKSHIGDTDLNTERTRKQTGEPDRVTNYYTIFSSRESTSQMSEEMYELAFYNFDFIFSYHPWSEIPLYIDYDNYYYFVQMKDDEDEYLQAIRKLNGYGVDEHMTYEELRQQTINWINKHHRINNSYPIAAHISHCYDNHHKNERQPSAIGQLRNYILDFLHKNGVPVLNYGTCKAFGDRIEEKVDPGHQPQYKVDHNNHYPFNIAFENKEIDGYSTEKLFQGMLSKYSVVIYFGEPFVKQRFPSDLLEKYKVFIDVRDFDTPMHLVKYLNYLLENQEAYLEYFEWRWQKVYGKEGIPRVQTHLLHDYFDARGKNTIPYCRMAERFVKERMSFYKEESKKEKIVVGGG